VNQCIYQKDTMASIDMSENNEGPPGVDWSQYFMIPQQELHLSDFDNKGELVIQYA